MRIAPMVINMLNMRQHMDLQKESFGGYSEQIADYTDKGLQNQQDTQRAVDLRSIVDPYSYRGQLPQPKLIILGTNDRYWPVDAANLYWDALEGEKYILYVPNNGHGIRDYPRVLGSVLALYQHVAEKKPLPKLDLEFHRPGRLVALAIVVRHQTAIRHGMDGERQDSRFPGSPVDLAAGPKRPSEGRQLRRRSEEAGRRICRRVCRSPVQRASHAVLSLDGPAGGAAGENCRGNFGR